ncbi:leucine-rich repeat protein, putative [Plasmodium ovale]|uniref:Leucine-rich repeat protein (LRR3) n=2 Tax=Plasmodium ovale TaxID=36330 RepID=A0A1A8X041_PLAOA|nr:leucine-rich repeat protein (LRR3) [Plasmodium ovale curtisi]SBS97039.1 leucine-rich repeat protein (LRR3) [Plasmodium ovale curtisi]SCP05762.1 leucine-rich repeat protein, putative [Plasmodium ovale]
MEKNCVQKTIEDDLLRKLTIVKISAMIKNGDISSCRELILKKMDIEECEELCQMKKLTKLDLSENKIKDLAMVEMNLNLKHITLEDNIIDEINYLQNLNNLIHLNLSYNCIKVIDNICQLKNLKTVILAYNEIENIPNLSNLQNLETLILKNNHIETFVKPSKEMKNLKKISLSFNRIRQFCFGSHFPNVQELRLNSNKLVHVERDIMYMASLKQLFLQDNYIMRPLFLDYLIELNFLKNVVISGNPFFKQMNLELLNDFVERTKKVATLNSVTIPETKKFEIYPFDITGNAISRTISQRDYTQQWSGIQMVRSFNTRVNRSNACIDKKGKKTQKQDTAKS